MSDCTFYWHDYETFGRSPRRDRPAQFAGIRTDADLNEIGEPLMRHCRPSPDYLPEPEACLLTGIVPQTALALGLPEHAFAEAIEAEFARPGTIGCGYNSIRFDDEVTRFLFWRNLIDPFGREWQNGCGRWDLLDTVRCAYALRPEGIEWPRHEDGRASFRLEHLSAANGIAHADAHDALADVRATIGLARIVKSLQPRLWAFCLSLRKKEAVLNQIGAGEPRPLLHVSGMFPADRGCLAVVWPLGVHPAKKNEFLVWDLSEDPAVLPETSAESIRERLFTRAEDLPPGTSRLPIKSIHINKSPVVASQLRLLTPAIAERWRIDLAQVERHAESARRLPPFPPSLWAEVFARPQRPPADVDEDLYGGFLEDDDRRALQRLRVKSPEALAASRPAFRDGRLEELLFRYRGRNFPQTLDDDERRRWAEHCRDRLCSGAAGALTLDAFRTRLDAMRAAADARSTALLAELGAYATSIAPACGTAGTRDPAGALSVGTAH